MVYITIPVIPSCFMAFFSDPYSPSYNFQFFIHLNNTKVTILHYNALLFQNSNVIVFNYIHDIDCDLDIQLVSSDVQ